jgi:hypothetical protein
LFACDIQEKIAEREGTLLGSGLRKWCKTTSSYNYLSTTGQESTTNYSWDGNTSSYQTDVLYNSSTFNDMGYVLNSETNYNDGTTSYQQLSDNEYDCNTKWCKTTSSYYYLSSTGDESMTNYNWDGNTSTSQTDDLSTASTFNDMGYVLNSEMNYDDGTTSYQQLWDNEYDCNNKWCKIISSYYYLSSTGDESTTTHNWDGNTSTSQSDVLFMTTTYNDWGYVLTSQIEYDDGTTDYQQISEVEYDCQ